MATDAKSKNARASKRRYWVSFDFGLGGSYREFYEWLDSRDASECGVGVATFLSDKSRDALAGEIKHLLRDQVRPRVYLISMGEGGRFVVGNRKAAPWTGYSVRNASVVDEV